MAIVKDPKLTIDHANNISNTLIELLSEEMKKFNGENDPAEHIYLVCHIVGNFYAKMCVALEGYGKQSAIEGLTADIINKTIEIIKNSLIDCNKEKIHTYHKKMTMQ